MTEMRVLVVEDDDGLRELLVRGLREDGFTVVAARDAAAALRLAEAGCAAMVLDIGLPDADGRDLCAALRAHGIAAPTLFLTARYTAEDRLSGVAASGDDYLTKPFHFAELVARLRTLLRLTPPRPGLEVSTLTRPPLCRPADSARLTPTKLNHNDACMT